MPYRFWRFQPTLIDRYELQLTFNPPIYLYTEINQFCTKKSYVEYELKRSLFKIVSN